MAVGGKKVERWDKSVVLGWGGVGKEAGVQLIVRFGVQGI